MYFFHVSLSMFHVPHQQTGDTTAFTPSRACFPTKIIADTHSRRNILHRSFVVSQIADGLLLNDIMLMDNK